LYREVVHRIAELTTTAFGLVAALAWNTAIQDWFAGQEELTAGGPLAYAVIVTIIAVLATVWIGRVAARAAGLGDEEDVDGGRNA
jgi:hypothetical protein